MQNCIVFLLPLGLGYNEGTLGFFMTLIIIGVVVVIVSLMQYIVHPLSRL